MDAAAGGGGMGLRRCSGSSPRNAVAGRVGRACLHAFEAARRLDTLRPRRHIERERERQRGRREMGDGRREMGDGRRETG